LELGFDADKALTYFNTRLIMVCACTTGLCFFFSSSSGILYMITCCSLSLSTSTSQMKATHDLEPALREGNASRVKECLSRGADVDSYLVGAPTQKGGMIILRYH